MTTSIMEYSQFEGPWTIYNNSTTWTSLLHAYNYTGFSTNSFNVKNPLLLAIAVTITVTAIPSQDIK